MASDLPNERMAVRPVSAAIALSGCTATLDEHSAFLHMLDDLLLLARKPAEDEAVWRAELARQVEELRDALAVHFASEELGPLFTQIPQEMPHWAPRIGRLGSEHSAVIHRLSALALRAGSLSRADLAGETLRLVALIRRHEAEETEILAHALWDDLGSAG